VLIERVRELLRCGVPAERILCTTFNRNARVELQQRHVRRRGAGGDRRHVSQPRLAADAEEGLAHPGGPRLCAATLRLQDAGAILDALAATIDAANFIRCLRGSGGLDEYYRAHEHTVGDAAG
jgi:hypothetical protein